MKDTSQDFGLFIDNLRVSRKISRENFVDGILSTRQYQRYLKGETSITNANLFQLINKLEMSILTIYSLFANTENSEFNYVSKIYNHLANMNYKMSDKLIKSFDVSTLTTKYNQSFFTLTAVSRNPLSARSGGRKSKQNN